MAIHFRTPCIMHAITREPAWFLRSQRFPALRCADRTLFSVYQSALKPRDYWGCAVLRMTDEPEDEPVKIILDGAGTELGLCWARAAGRSRSGAGFHTLPNAHMRKRYEARNGAA